MVQNVILTAINFKGIEQVKREVKELAENCLCSESYIVVNCFHFSVSLGYNTT